MLLLIAPMALVMGWLSQEHPHSGGVAYFVRLAFGERWGVHVGWFFLMSVAIGAPIASITGGLYLRHALGLASGTETFFAAFILLFAICLNYRGMKLSGLVQIVMILGIIVVLVLAIASSAPHIEKSNFTPFLPHGWLSVGKAAVLLYWCFIGWEAISHLSEEFADRRDAVRGILIAAGLVGILYFLTAFVVVGTHRYAGEQATSAFVHMLVPWFGGSGRILAGITCFMICSTGVIAYVGAASRLAFALGREGYAPDFFQKISEKHRTPSGGLYFLTGCFILILAVYGTGFVPLPFLLALPNATFILTYLAGCVAGIRLLRHFKWKRRMSVLSALCTAAIVPWIGWALLYPALISCVVGAFLQIKKRKNHTTVSPPDPTRKAG